MEHYVLSQTLHFFFEEKEEEEKIKRKLKHIYFIDLKFQYDSQHFNRVVKQC